MNKILGTIFLICISMAGVLSQYFSPISPVDKINVVSASYFTYKATIEPMCVSKIASGQQRIFPTGLSIENLIALTERLEILLANDTDTNLRQHLGADNVAKLLLRRFRFDGYNPDAASIPYQNPKDQNIVEMTNAIFTQTENTSADPTYYFPDKFFNQAELCSLYYMLSHNVYKVAAKGDRTVFSQQTFRGKRQAYSPYNNRQQQQNYGNKQNNQNQRQSPYSTYNRQNAEPNIRDVIQSNFLIPHEIKEEGVVSFRGNQDEAIAAARVLTGVVAGLSTDMKTSANAVLKVFKPSHSLPSDKTIDPVMAVTIADLWGFAAESPGQNEKQYYYGAKGQWISGSCTTYYGLTDIQANQFPNATRNMKATKAELRGGLDGYLIGKNLRSVVISDMKNLRLSTILRSYYSKPKTQKSSAFTVSYCNRDQQINSQELQNTAGAYSEIMSFKNGINNPDPLLTEFNTAILSAQQKETNGLSDYCSQIPGGVLDKTAPCETPSDIIYIIDGQTTQKLRDSAKIVSLIDGNTINIGREGGAVSIFFNSQGTNSINPDASNNMPFGPNGWPFLPAAFNSTNTGSAQCRIDDFNTTTPQPVANTGKYLKYLNQTLFNYKYWNPRTNASGIPAKTAVLIDFDSVPEAPDSGTDSNDYNYFKDQLKYRHRDVKFIAVTYNQDLFKDILRDQNDKESPTNILSGASNLAKKICENPATFQYYDCYKKRSYNIEYIGLITPGYKQNWAMYPEFFHNSTSVKFTFKAEDGDIRVCYDRLFPPERQDSCKDLKLGEEVFFNMSNPCKGKSLQSCDPFYFTVWGKDRTSNTQCLDQRCLSLDQIKFTVRHFGVHCSSYDNKTVIINKNETNIDLNNVLDNLESLSANEISTRIGKLDIALYKIEELKTRYTADRQILLEEIVDRNK